MLTNKEDFCLLVYNEKETHMIELCSENIECCTYPKGFYFEYVRYFYENGKTFLEGKGRYGCVTKIELNDQQAKTWLRKYNEQSA
jgi:hypothetical protein